MDTTSLSLHHGNLQNIGLFVELRTGLSQRAKTPQLFWWTIKMEILWSADTPWMKFTIIKWKMLPIFSITKKRPFRKWSRTFKLKKVIGIYTENITSITLIFRKQWSSISTMEEYFNLTYTALKENMTHEWRSQTVSFYELLSKSFSRWWSSVHGGPYFRMRGTLATHIKSTTTGKPSINSMLSSSRDGCQLFLFFEFKL